MELNSKFANVVAVQKVLNLYQKGACCQWTSRLRTSWCSARCSDNETQSVVNTTLDCYTYLGLKIA